MDLSIESLGTRFVEALDRLDRGEQVTVTYEGKPRAKLIAIDADEAKPLGTGDDPAFGMWRNHDEKADVASYVHSLRNRRGVRLRS